MRDQAARVPAALGAAVLSSQQTSAEISREIARVQRGEARVLFVAPERVVLPAFAAVLRSLPRIGYRARAN